MTETNLYDAGFKDGLNLGYDVGFEDGFKEAQPRIEELKAKLAWAMEGLPQMKSDLEGSDYNSAYHVCKHILEQLTGGKDE